MAFSLPAFLSALTILTIPAYLLVAGALFQRNLWHNYLFFWIGILAECGVLVLYQTAPKIYLQVYQVAQPILILLYVMMVVEVFGKVFARYPGIARFAKRLILISLLLAFIVALASAGSDLADGWSGASLTRRLSFSLRAVSTALSIFLICIAAFLVWMPVPLPPNTIRHSFLFFFYFTATTVVHYVLNKGPRGIVLYANLFITSFNLVALTCWFFLLKPEGELAPAVRNPPRADAGVLLERLESLNKQLSPSSE